MSKLDQIKALGDAKRAARKSSPAPIRASHVPRQGEMLPKREPAGGAGEAYLANSKRGRPLAKDAAKALMRTRPWLAEGMSRASWYSRQAEQRGKK